MGHEGVVKMLLMMGRVDINVMDIYSWTPLSLAVVRGHEGVATPADQDR
jgi:ankyrin repeat protein